MKVDWNPIATGPRTGKSVLLGYLDGPSEEGRWVDEPNHWGEVGWYASSCQDPYSHHPDKPDVWSPMPKVTHDPKTIVAMIQALPADKAKGILQSAIDHERDLCIAFIREQVSVGTWLDEIQPTIACLNHNQHREDD